MFSSIQSIPGLIFANSDVKAKIRPGVEARISCAISCASVLRDDKIKHEVAHSQRTYSPYVMIHRSGG